MALAVTLLLPVPQVTSGAIVALLILAKGVRRAAIEAIVATLVLIVASVLTGRSIGSVTGLAAGALVPVALLAILLAKQRSLTLTVQVSVIVAVTGFLAFQVLIPDAAVFWQPYLDAMAKVIRESGLQLQTASLTPDIMTMSAALALWLLSTTGLLFGYALQQRLTAETVSFGRFRDLNFGRVIAFALAVVLLLAPAIGVSWLQNVAYIVFVMFMLQGLAIVHWLRWAGKLPLIAVVSMYLLFPFLQLLLVAVLASVGYVDAWIEFRRRWNKT